MGINFPEELLVGVPAIDDYHRRLYDHANLLRDAMRAGQRADAGSILRFLREYGREHFAAEEQMMASAVYPDLEAHRTSHERFRNDLASLERRFASAGASASNLVELSGWLADWLTEHIRREDGPMVRWLADHRAASAEGAGPDGAL